MKNNIGKKNNNNYSTYKISTEYLKDMISELECVEEHDRPIYIYDNELRKLADQLRSKWTPKYFRVLKNGKYLVSFDSECIDMEVINGIAFINDFGRTRIVATFKEIKYYLDEAYIQIVEK